MALTLPNGQIILDYDEAVARLEVHEDEGGRRTVHTYLESPIALIGADWTEDSVLALLREAASRPEPEKRIQETGPSAQGVGHGVAAWSERHGVVFIAARPR